jgi:hypothetical protein
MKDVPIARTDENKIVGWVNGSEKILSDPDCISIQADDESVAEANRISKNIWIDHCEFYNEDPDVMTDKDRYDVLIDGKNNSTILPSPGAISMIITRVLSWEKVTVMILTADHLSSTTSGIFLPACPDQVRQVSLLNI